MANSNRDTKKRPHPFGLDEFFYRDSETAKEEKDAQLIEWLNSRSSNG